MRDRFRLRLVLDRGGVTRENNLQIYLYSYRIHIGSVLNNLSQFDHLPWKGKPPQNILRKAPHSFSLEY